jgi:hypothetical protein
VTTPRQTQRRDQHDEGVFGAGVERDKFTAGGGDIGDQASGLRGDDRVIAAIRQNPHQFDGAGVRCAAIERRKNDEDASAIGYGLRARCAPRNGSPRADRLDM